MKILKRNIPSIWWFKILVISNLFAALFFTVVFGNVFYEMYMAKYLGKNPSDSLVLFYELSNIANWCVFLLLPAFLIVIIFNKFIARFNSLIYGSLLIVLLYLISFLFLMSLRLYAFPDFMPFMTSYFDWDIWDLIEPAKKIIFQVLFLLIIYVTPVFYCVIYFYYYLNRLRS